MPSQSIIRDVLCTVISALVIGIVGTFTYRLGAAYNVPYGLVLSLLIVAFFAFLAGVRGGIWHELLHAVIASCAAWYLALQGSITSTLVVTGGAALTTFWSINAAYIWLYGIIFVHVVVAFLPSKWLRAFRDDE
ncbi:alcohol dehydrogenase [Alloscardovia theropitheci]|uniref:Alcohol dehydrogenase n=1 Tax=Alloscardovia theropitheci TaxID=2496842 RepID=A0A4R0QY39_9BIFI|nr:alcohol dehydrogenase [Alloscardovia theropitheci]TCD54640.1 alcohol dehydrogenase [Alloscardovia theropitheci]